MDSQFFPEGTTEIVKERREEGTEEKGKCRNTRKEIYVVAYVLYSLVTWG